MELEDSGLTGQDAEWYREGFTNYYGIRIAHEAGGPSAGAAAACWADLNGEMRYLERAAPRSLVEVSARSREDRFASRLVYSKGALFALLLERRLRRAGRSPDDAVRAVLLGGRRQVGTDELRGVFHDA